MLEDDRALGPPHSLHADIRKKGLGNYSHWNGSIIFSSSDGTDPRTNGRTYSIKASAEVNPQLQLLLVSILAIADIAFLILFHRDIIFLLQ